jgi:hypothetical protein
MDEVGVPDGSTTTRGRFASGLIGAAALLLFATGAAAAALIPAGGKAPAANSTSFSDPAGDVIGDAPDIGGVTVSNDDAGTITVRIAFPNRSALRTSRTNPNERDFVGIYLDTDRNPQTGCVGADFTVGAGPRFDAPSLIAAVVFACSGSTLRQRGPADASYALATRTLEVRFGRSLIGFPPGFDLNILATSNIAGAAAVDSAPNSGVVWSYSIVAPPPAATTATTTRPKPRDTSPPEVHALASSGRRGSVARLRYTVYDLEGQTREEVRVLRGAQTLRVLKRSFSDTRGSRVYSVSWRIPRSAPAALRFCVRAWDEAGNRSRSSCARLAVR